MNATTKTTLDLAKTRQERVPHPRSRSTRPTDAAGTSRRSPPDAAATSTATGDRDPGRRLPPLRDRPRYRRPQRHDAIDGDTWTADELVDYLRAVGQPKDTTSWDRKNDN